MQPGPQTETRISAWRCDHCSRQYETRREAEQCEERHASSERRKRLYAEAMASGRPLVGKFQRAEDGGETLTRVLAILGKSEREFRDSYSRKRDVADTFLRLTPAVGQIIEDYLPDEVNPAHSWFTRYISIREAIDAGWRPFFSEHYQNEFPLSIREQVADAFLALTEGRQRDILLARKTLSGTDSEDE